jgi:anti-sigma B factor antagonist
MNDLNRSPGSDENTRHAVGASGLDGVIPGELEIKTDVEDGGHTLKLAGELDLATAPRLDAAIAQACDGGATRVVLDLTNLRFLDSAGLRAILYARSNCIERGCGFLLTRPQPPVERLFALTGLTQTLAMDADPSAR